MIRCIALLLLGASLLFVAILWPLLSRAGAEAATNGALPVPIRATMIVCGVASCWMGMDRTLR